MKNVFFNNEILSAEKKIISSLKIPSLILMENAGKNFTDIFLSRMNKLTPSFKNEVIIFAGKGSNAGDGFVIARHLCNKNIKVNLVLIYSEKDLSGDALINLNILKNSKNILEKLTIFRFGNISGLKKKINFNDSIIVDAIFGVGFRGVPDKKLSDIFKFLNNLHNKIIFSVDVPSGLSQYDQVTESVKADITVSMGVKKFDTVFYNGRECSGEIEVAEIGISDKEFSQYNSNKIYITEEEDVRNFIPFRKKNSNKYTNGKVLVLAGSRGLTGAAYLSSVSALRTGAGAVVTIVPESVNDILEIKMTEVMTIPVKETEEFTLSLDAYSIIKNKLKWADTVLIGPGLSKNEETMELVRFIVEKNNLNYLIDADGIFAFKDHINILKKRNIILTPHFGEFSLLTGIDLQELINNFYKFSKDFAEENNITLVLKNSPTIITNGDKFIINSTGRENLATSGSGDVLSGIIAGLYSQTGKAMDSAVSGSYIHGRCGDRLFELTGSSSTLAGDLITEIPIVKNLISAV